MTDDPTVPTDDETYVDVNAFEAVREPPEQEAGSDWTESVSDTDWEEHEKRLRSVVDAQQEAEVMGADVLIGW